MSFADDASGLDNKAQVTVPVAKRLTPLAAIERIKTIQLL